ncbi:MAG TPA: hypothetical protein VIW03_14070, partial [Anaeromyxobacter sp.]
WGNGSAGSQALLGIPRVRALLDDPDLSPHSSVWPFTTGPRLAPRGDGPRIVHAEVYPSLVTVTPRAKECKDAAQVRALARFFATEDAEGRLETLFGAPAGQPTSVLGEEGWVLGASLRSPRWAPRESWARSAEEGPRDFAGPAADGRRGAP